MPTLNPEAQKGLDYFKQTNPSLAAQITSALAAKPIDIGAVSAPPTVSIPQLPAPTVPDIGTIKIGNTPTQDRLATERESLLNDISTSTDKLATKSARKSELEVEQGIPELGKQLNEITKQIGQIQSEALAASEKSENRFAPTFDIRGEQAQIERQRAVRVFGLSAASEALQGNINLANDNVERALEAEFGGEQAKIENAKFLLQENWNTFNAEEKRRAEETLVQLNERERLLNEQKDTKAKIYDVLKTAATNKADNATLERIRIAKTPEEAIALAGDFIRDPNADLQTELLGEQILTQRQNRANARVNQLIERAALGDTAALQELGISNDGNKTRVTTKEASALNKEIASNDTYKAIDKALSSWRALKEYEKVAVNPQNPIADPIEAGKARATYNTALLQLKEFYNLGVLNGPDLDILKELVPSSVKSAAATAVSAVPVVGGFTTDYLTRKRVENAISNQKVQFEDKLDSDFLTLRSQYGTYDASQVTLLQDIDRKYLQTKMELNPSVKAFIEANPDMSVEDVIQVINTRI
ncbi:MAG: hypothetical protein KGZ73_05215 [Rhizobiales bacterium]|nr:hypothetical protein [Hyphomicrobiales bacterium]